MIRQGKLVPLTTATDINSISALTAKPEKLHDELSVGKIVLRLRSKLQESLPFSSLGRWC